jgi:hypothetical protein
VGGVSAYSLVGTDLRSSGPNPASSNGALTLVGTVWDGEVCDGNLIAAAVGDAEKAVVVGDD